MRFLACVVFSLCSLANARVTFDKSEVLQAPDIAVTNKANFKCKNQCRVYADRKYNLLVITQNGNLVTNFNNIVSDTFAPKGVLLQPGDYMLENRGEVNPVFVFYIVDSTSPNYGAPVYTPQQTIGVTMAGPSRYATVLSSFEAMWWSGFTGAFPAGYPRIYATGFDAAGDPSCHPVYQARTQYNAENSWPTIATAVQTVDFGFVGVHNVTANYRKLDDMSRGVGTTVYTSPGYVGCSNLNGQNYHSSLSAVKDAFKLDADSLDVEASYNGITTGETVHFRVNKDNHDMVGSSGQTLYGKHYDKGNFDIEISWERLTPSSSFAVQIDFGSANDVPRNSATMTTSANSGSTYDGGLQTTTKIGRSLSVMTAVSLVIAASLFR